MAAPAIDDGRYRGPFATLTPCNAPAMRLASSVYGQIVNDDKYNHHLLNMEASPQVRLETMLRAHDAREVSCPIVSSGAVSSSAVSSSEATVPDEENDPMADMVWPVRYTFSFDGGLLVARSGWAVGYGRAWDTPGLCGKTDILIAVDASSRPEQLKSKHALFNFVSPSGQFGVRQGREGAALMVGGRSVGRSFRLLTLREEVISIGNLQYRFEYTVQPEHEERFLRTKEHYFSFELQRQLPNAFTSVTPSTNDLHFGTWTVMSTAGAGSESVVRAAISTSGQLAAVVRKEYYRPGDRVSADRSVNALKEIRSLLDGSVGRGGTYIVQLHDVFVTRSNELYILTVPLGFTYLGSPLCRAHRHCYPVFFSQMISALASLHQIGFLHNDIKPGNIVVKSFDPPKAILIDLSGSVPLRDGQYVQSSPGTNGTVGYLAPEREASCDSRYAFPSDIWSLGTVGLQLLVKQNRFAPFPHVLMRNPFRDFDLTELDDAGLEENTRNEAQRLRNTARRTLRELAMVAERLPHGIESLLTQMLALRPADRISAQDACRHPVVAESLDRHDAEWLQGSKRTAPNDQVETGRVQRRAILLD